MVYDEQQQPALNGHSIEAADTGERTDIERTPMARAADGRTERKRLTRLALGELPQGMRGAGKTAGKLRLALEAAVVERHGEIDLVRAGLIVTACRWERHAAVAGWLLRQHAVSMTHAERLTYSREIARASTERDKAVSALRLDRTAADVLDALYSSPVAHTGDVASPSASTAMPPDIACNSLLAACNANTPSPPPEHS